MHDDLSYLSPRDRALCLKTLPFAQNLGTDDVMMAALQMDQREFRRGDVLLEEGEPIEAMYILLEGTVDLQLGGEHVRTIAAPGRIGLIGLLASRSRIGQRGAPGDITAASTLSVLELESSLVYAMLRASFEFYASMIAWIARQLLEDPPMEVMGSSCGKIEGDGDAELDFVDRLRWFRDARLFQHANLEAVGELVCQQSVIRADAGDVLWGRGDSPDRILSVITGCIEYEKNDDASHSEQDEAQTFDGQYLHGLLEALAGEPRARTALATDSLLAMALDRDILFEVLEDQPDMALNMMAELAAAAVRSRWGRADSDGSEGTPRDPIESPDRTRQSGIGPAPAWTRLTGME